MSTDDIPLYIPTQTEQDEIVAICNKFKIASLWHSKKKKTKMQKSYAYIKSEFFDSRDLLPRPDAEGADRDNNPGRPQLFMPLSRQLYKMLVSTVYLTLFATDDDYFRIRAISDDPIPGMFRAGPLNPMTGQPTAIPITYPEMEDTLTEGAKYKFKQCKIPGKLKGCIEDLAWSGNSMVIPTIRRNTSWSWTANTVSMAYEPAPVREEPELDLEICDPIHVYIDPKGKVKGREQWGYFCVRKLVELLDNPLYFNKDKLPTLTNTQIYESQLIEGIYLNRYNDLTTTFLGDDQNLDVDHYYFPYLKMRSVNPRTGKPYELRNMLVSVAGGRVLIEFRPNMAPRGLPPGVHCTWMDDKESPYGTGPIEDIQHIQRHINIISNYLIEVLARIGNKLAIKEGTDMTEYWGIVAGIITCDNPETDVKWFTGDYIEIKELLNYIGILKAEAQQLAGSTDPFQGSSQLDFKKTATEINVLEEKAISVNRDIVEHIADSMELIFERFMYMLPEIYPTPTRMPMALKGGGVHYQSVDFNLLKSGKYVIELVGANPSQSKQAQIQGITEFLTGFVPQPQAIGIFKPILVKAFGLQGIKDASEMIDEILENLQKMPPPPNAPNRQA